jgi:hypothetical protein
MPWQFLGMLLGEALATIIVVVLWIAVEPTGMVRIGYIGLFILMSAVGGGLFVPWLVHSSTDSWRWKSG